MSDLDLIRSLRYLEEQRGKPSGLTDTKIKFRFTCLSPEHRKAVKNRIAELKGKRK